MTETRAAAELSRAVQAVTQPLRNPADLDPLLEGETLLADQSLADRGAPRVVLGRAMRRFAEEHVARIPDPPVGFGSHHGTVIAGREWGAPMERMRVPAGRPGSWEDVLHQAGGQDILLLFAEAAGEGPLHAVRGHRAIGVVYRPEHEHRGNYVPTVLPRRYDAFLARPEE
jgi:hypothetical protein